MLHIEEIIIPASIADHYDAACPFNSLTDIKRLNAFVGPNNSGKSRLLRAMFLAGTNLMISTDNVHARTVRSSVRCASRLVNDLSLPREFDEKITALLEAPTYGFHGCGNHLGHKSSQDSNVGELGEQIRQYASNQRPEDRKPNNDFSRSLGSVSQGLRALTAKSSSQGPQQQAPPPPFRGADFVYIPTLRGMRLAIDDENLKFAYFDRTWTDYVKGQNKQNQSRDEDINQARKAMSGKTIVTGLDFYDVLTDRLLGSLADRTFIREYEAYLSATFFRGEPVALIPRRDHDTVNIKIGSETERPIQSLGDGLQQLIILTLTLFERRDKPLFLFIEEPDLFLHPGFQRVLIDAIFENDNPNLYVFVTTHSSEFLDITVSEENCSIFRCTKQPAIRDELEHDPRFSVTNATSGDHELLKHIGVRPSSVMFANCTIWVEGITDRLYYGRYLELLLKSQDVNLIENLHYAFVEYGGGNITHWSFLDEEEGMDVERICARLFLISDNDEGKDARHDQLAKVLNDRFHRLDVKEVENLLTPAIIEAVIRDYEGDTIELKQFNQSAYKNRFLGRFIDSDVLMDKSKSKRYGKLKTCYEDASGTVKDKVNFCRKALTHIDRFDDLSDEAKAIADKLFRFVVSENK